jgi:hypothetical protein
MRRQAGLSWQYFCTMLSASEGLLLANEEQTYGPHQFFLYDLADSNFTPLGDTIVGRNVIGGQAANAQDLFAVIDPAGYYNNNQPNYYSYGGLKMSIAHSTDSGKDWTYSFPIDTNSWKGSMSLTPMERGYGNGHFFLTGGRVTDTISGERNKIDDYQETSDDGVTWETVNSVTGGRVFRIANPAQNVLWAAVGRVPNVPKYLGLYSDESVAYDTEEYKGTPTKFVDSMFVSIDGGKTWAKDGKTFAGDTICAMRWLSATNGYVITLRNTSTYIYHFTGSIDSTQDTTKSYVSTQTSTASAVIHNHPVTLTAFPDPSNDYVHINIPYNDGIHEMHIYDVVEREVFPPTVLQGGELTVDVKALSAGSYFMQISGTSGWNYVVRFSREP